MAPQDCVLVRRGDEHTDTQRDRRLRTRGGDGVHTPGREAPGGTGPAAPLAVASHHSAALRENKFPLPKPLRVWPWVVQPEETPKDFAPRTWGAAGTKAGGCGRHPRIRAAGGGSGQALGVNVRPGRVVLVRTEGEAVGQRDVAGDVAGGAGDVTRR